MIALGVLFGSQSKSQSLKLYNVCRLISKLPIRCAMYSPSLLQQGYKSSPCRLKNATLNLILHIEADFLMSQPDLFQNHLPADNLLPYDGIVNDFGVILNPDEADELFIELLHRIPWQHDEVLIFGKRITTARRVAWYGDSDFPYTYSGIRRTALPWHPALLTVKQTVEQCLAGISPTVFNSCLLNLYSDGLEGMSWHSDDEKELGSRTTIASLSLGATRKFAFKHKQTKEKREIMLHHGQLIVMRGETQRHWQHAVMKSTKITAPRINLTWRTFVADNA